MFRFGACRAVVFRKRGALSQAARALDNFFLNVGNDDLEIEISGVGSPQSLNAIEIITKTVERLSAGDFFPDLSQLFE